LPGAARPAFETRPAAGASTAIRTSAAAVGAASAAIRTSATAIASTVASAAAERPLETRAWIAADAGRVAREIFTRSRWAADARSTSFAREENYIFFDDRCAFFDGFASGGSDRLFFDMFRLGMFVLDLIMLDMFLLAVLVLAMRGVVFGVFLSHVRGEFRAVGRSSSFDFLDFFLGEFGDFSDWRCFLFFRLFFRFFFVEFGATNDGIGFRFLLCLFVFGLDETGGECGDLIFVQFGVIPGGFRVVGKRLVRRLHDRSASSRGFFGGTCRFFRG
jgi:hypothetical protein